LDGEALSTKVVHFTTGWNIDASVGLWAERLRRRTELDADGPVLVEHVVHHAVAALVRSSEVVGLVIMVAAFDLRQTLFVVVGWSESRSAKRAGLLDEVNGSAVRDDADAL
jgi:hypothetical protein